MKATNQAGVLFRTKTAPASEILAKPARKTVPETVNGDIRGVTPMLNRTVTLAAVHPETANGDMQEASPNLNPTLTRNLLIMVPMTDPI